MRIVPSPLLYVRPGRGGHSSDQRLRQYSPTIHRDTNPARQPFSSYKTFGFSLTACHRQISPL